MKYRPVCVIAMGMMLVCAGYCAGAQARTLKFSGYEWEVRSAGLQGPGPNRWDPENVSVDSKGQLHLKITKVADEWRCAELTLKKRLGFGRYQFQVIGRIDQLDRNIVLGLFNYPTPDVGKEGTNEIDIEFARWAAPMPIMATIRSGTAPARRTRRETPRRFLLR